MKVVLEKAVQDRAVDLLRSGLTPTQVVEELGDPRVGLARVLSLRRHAGLTPWDRIRASLDARVRRLSPEECAAYQRELEERDARRRAGEVAPAAPARPAVRPVPASPANDDREDRIEEQLEAREALELEDQVEEVEMSKLDEAVKLATEVREEEAALRAKKERLAALLAEAEAELAEARAAAGMAPTAVVAWPFARTAPPRGAKKAAARGYVTEDGTIPGSTRHRVLKVLRSDPDRTWKLGEIQERVESSPHSVEVALAELVKKATVRRTGRGVYRAA